MWSAKCRGGAQTKIPPFTCCRTQCQVGTQQPAVILLGCKSVISIPRASRTKYPALWPSPQRGKVPRRGSKPKIPPSHSRKTHRHLYPSVRLAHNILHSFCLNACPPSSPRRVSRTSVSRLGPSPRGKYDALVQDNTTD
jgi:hypothetical protein